MVQLDDMNMQNTANTLWAYATLQVSGFRRLTGCIVHFNKLALGCATRSCATHANPYIQCLCSVSTPASIKAGLEFLVIEFS